MSSPHTTSSVAPGSRRCRQVLGALGALDAVAVLSAVTGAWAAHRFSDVPNSHPFHGEIAAVTDACIAGGFADGTYRPGAAVTRQAMAAFLARTASTTAARQGAQVVNFGANNPNPTLRTITVAASPLSGCTQWALVHAGANVFTNSTHADTCVNVNAACNGELTVLHNGVPVASGFVRFSGSRSGSRVSTQALVALPGGSGNHTFELRAAHQAVREQRGITTQPTLSVTVMPFGGLAPTMASTVGTPSEVAELEALLEAGGAP